MRRFLAYIVMMLTVICALVFNTQAVLDQKTDAMEYGSGTELVYSLAKRNKSDYADDAVKDLDEFDNLSDIDIEKVVMNRLDLAGVRNANVRIVEGNSETQEGYQLHISLSPLNESDLSRVKEVIGITGSLSMGTIGDDTVMYESAGTLFDTSDTLATIVYNGTTPYPAIKVKKEDYDTLKDKASEAAEAHKNDTTKEARRYNSDDDDDSSSDDSTTVYLWTNKKTTDTYNKAFGTNDTIVQDEVKEKVIAKIDLSNYDSDTERISITSDIDGNAFDISSARAFVNMLNGTDYGFDIEYLYSNSVTATFGKNDAGPYRTYIVAGVILLAVVVLLIVFYGFSGITASLTMLVSVLVSFLLFSVLGFEFSIAAVVALAVIVIQSVVISLNYFERVKRELKKGKDLEKANKEGYHKSFFGAMDCSAVALLASLFCFLIAVGSYKTFFGVIMIGSIFTFVITNFVNKWMLYWLCKDVHDGDKFSLFGHKSKKEHKVVKFAFNKPHFTHKLLVVLPAIIAVGLGIALPTSYLLSKNNSFFNNSNDFSNGYTLNIMFKGESQSYTKLSTKEVYLNYLTKIGTLDDDEAYSMVSSEAADTSSASFIYYPETAFVNIVEKKDEEGNTYFNQYFSVNVDRDLSKVTTKNGSDVVSVIERTMQSGSVEGVDGVTGDISFDGYGHYINDSLDMGCYLTKPTNISHNYKSMILLVFLISCFAFVYLLVRFGINVALTSLVSGTVFSGLLLLLLVACRIPFSSFTGFGIVAAVLVFNILSVILLGGNKETLKENNLKKTATNDDRESIANDIANRSLVITIPSFGLIALMGIGLFFIYPSLTGLSISMIVFAILGLLLSYFYAVPLYFYFASHISFRKISESMEKRREKHGKKKAVANKDGIIYVDQDGPHETIIPGVNEFHH